MDTPPEGTRVNESLQINTGDLCEPGKIEDVNVGWLPLCHRVKRAAGGIQHELLGERRRGRASRSCLEGSWIDSDDLECSVPPVRPLVPPTREEHIPRRREDEPNHPR